MDDKIEIILSKSENLEKGQQEMKQDLTGNRKIRNRILIAGVCIIAGWFVLNQLYFYNPFNFTSDKVTRGSWYWYKNPVTAKITHYNKQKKVEEVTISDKSEIRMFLNGLKNAKQVEVYQVPTNINIEEQYSVELLSGSYILFIGIGFPKDNILALNYGNPEMEAKQVPNEIDYTDISDIQF